MKWTEARLPPFPLYFPELFFFWPLPKSSQLSEMYYHQSVMFYQNEKTSKVGIIGKGQESAREIVKLLFFIQQNIKLFKMTI